MNALWRTFYRFVVAIGICVLALVLVLNIAPSRPLVTQSDDYIGPSETAVENTISNTLPKSATEFRFCRASVGMGGRLRLYRFAAPFVPGDHQRSPTQNRLPFADAEEILERRQIEKVEEDEAVGFLPRKSLSDPLPPARYLFMIDKNVRLEILVDHDTHNVVQMGVRIEPPLLTSRGNYYRSACSAVTFHDDGTYSIRFVPKLMEDGKVGGMDATWGDPG